MQKCDGVERIASAYTKEVLTPYGIDETFVFLESCVWQAPPSPNMTKIMTPKNSAAGSRTYFLGMDRW